MFARSGDLKPLQKTSEVVRTILPYSEVFRTPISSPHSDICNGEPLSQDLQYDTHFPFLKHRQIQKPIAQAIHCPATSP